jgi:acetyl-CoA carboxylase carboxyltransferase component
MYLKARYTGYGARRGTYLGRKLREGRKVVAQQGGGIGKLHARKLHSIAAIARKTNYYAVYISNLGGVRRGGGTRVIIHYIQILL